MGTQAFRRLPCQSRRRASLTCFLAAGDSSVLLICRQLHLRDTCVRARGKARDPSQVPVSVFVIRGRDSVP
jgi:hypothetical protein